MKLLAYKNFVPSLAHPVYRRVYDQNTCELTAYTDWDQLPYQAFIVTTFLRFHTSNVFQQSS